MRFALQARRSLNFRLDHSHFFFGHSKSLPVSEGRILTPQPFSDREAVKYE
jgi:hypothetical protein